MYDNIKQQFQEELDSLEASGLFKKERIITTPQGACIDTKDHTNTLNFCANNYLGLSADPDVIEAGIDAMMTYGFGLSSVRFICGTQNIHKELEQKTAEFLGMEDCILYAAAFDANGGVFEPLLSKEDAIISDELNHASIIDGIRLCKAQRHRYKHNDMQALEEELKKASGARRKLIVTDGVFSMDGTIAQLDKICDLAEKYGAMVMVDECHATGFIGETGRGTHEYKGVMDQVDIITGTYGKALGGASGGFTAARKEIVALLRQKSRPYLFSNTLAPAIAGASLRVLEHLENSNELIEKLRQNTEQFRAGMTQAGFDIIPGTHPIVPVMLYDAKLAQQFASKLLEEGIYVIAFFYPVVPKEKARIRVQLSASHTQEQIAKAIAAFTKVGTELGVLNTLV
ncbi:glycine C-acetyltransferase [Zobellia galactanivorans]|uniref:2-amino-3-ketobutyrate coenzyme A ligase n=1 Tax=Zobellia galactanivorans (strain DSM 12802 / CCUG 47099 / CIP 106680 / NCIMB 13871 / Dsij) TaxID=63186 RepID=G0KZS6_ZOBGA|nr:glycine C-acetyltransferase [Zobellia galactanivorans]CAZ97154.1 Glycine C-acetyltransferase [Zobellia galactanivorans]